MLEQRGNGLAIAGFVCGIVGLLVVQYILGPLAIIFGSIGIRRGNRGAAYRGLAIAGLVLGVLDLAVLALLIAVYVSRHG